MSLVLHYIALLIGTNIRKPMHKRVMLLPLQEL